MATPHNNKKHALLYPALICWPSGVQDHMFQNSKLVVERLPMFYQPMLRVCMFYTPTKLQKSPEPVDPHNIPGTGATAILWNGCWGGTTRSRPLGRMPRRAPGRTWTGRGLAHLRSKTTSNPEPGPTLRCKKQHNIWAGCTCQRLCFRLCSRTLFDLRNRQPEKLQSNTYPCTHPFLAPTGCGECGQQQQGLLCQLVAL